MLRFDGGSARDAAGRVGADLPARLRTALLLDTRDVLGADGRVAIDLPCLGCGYNQRTLATDGRCPECGHEVAATVRERGEPAAVRLWLEDVSAGLRVLSWSTMCVAVACIGGLIVLARAGLGGFALAALPGLMACLFLVIGADAVTVPPPHGASALRRHLRFRTHARFAFLGTLVSLVLGCIAIGAALLAQTAAIAVFAVGTALLLAISVALLAHLDTLLNLAAPPGMLWFARSTYAAPLVLLVAGFGVVVSSSGAVATLGALVFLVAATAPLCYGYALRQTARVLTTAAEALPAPEPASEPTP